MSPSRPQRVPPGSRPRRDGPAPSQCHLGIPQPPRGDAPGPGALAGCPRDVPSSLASVGGSVAAGILRAPDYCSGGGGLGSGVTASYFHSAAPTATGWGGAGASPTPAPLRPPSLASPAHLCTPRRGQGRALGWPWRVQLREEPLARGRVQGMAAVAEPVSPVQPWGNRQGWALPGCCPAQRCFASAPVPWWR